MGVDGVLVMGLSTRNIHTRALDRIFKLNEEIISRLHQTVRVISDQCSVYIHAGQIADLELEYIVQFKLMCNLEPLQCRESKVCRSL